MGGLIGTATTAKDGLMSRKYCVAKIADNIPVGNSKLFKMSGSYGYATFELIANTDNGRMAIYTFSYSVYTADFIKPSLIKSVDFGGSVKFFKKGNNTNLIYIQLNTVGNATSLYIRCSTGNYSINIEESNESIEDLTEIQLR
ncbi:hypothetical protein [Bacteroides mediterraneensis]|uniref:hypothetical protein n=1 Tax=Bacteroides mediterraneensis TaxID=1841856 RepID=UPI0026ED3B92|nr:hypothetical protein [Bacteroides mediterraneensis]